MRTTLTLDPDVAARLAEVQRERGWTFKEAVNQTLRLGLGGRPGAEGTAYRMPVKDLGVLAGVDVDRIRDQLGVDDDARDVGR